MQKITPFLWFDDQAEEAAGFYVSIFQNSRIVNVSRYEDTPGGRAMGVTFVLEGQEFQALNGGPQFPFTEAISLFVQAADQEEIDELWNRLTSDGGAPGRCGWLKDKYGLSWQIVPPALQELLSDPDPVKASRTMQAMLGMGKLDIAALRAAHDGD